MGTLTLGRFRRKIRAFELYVNGGLLQRDWGQATCDFVVVTGSWDRLRGLWKTARKEVPARSWPRYLFATDEALTADPSARQAAWLTLAGAYVEWPSRPVATE